MENDRDVKARLYARAGILETWVVDLNGERVIVFRGQFIRLREAVVHPLTPNQNCFPNFHRKKTGPVVCWPGFVLTGRLFKPFRRPLFPEATS